MKRAGKGALKLSFRAAGIPPERVRGQVDRVKAAVKDRVRRFVLVPDQLQGDVSAMLVPELERLGGQLAILRQQHAAVRERVERMEAIHAELMPLIEEAISRLSGLDQAHTRAIEALRDQLQPLLEGGSERADLELLPRPASARR